MKSLTEKETSVPGIIVRDKGLKRFIPLNQILYLSKAGRKAEITCTEGKFYDTRRPAVLIPDSLRKRFIHCHQSYWVNREMFKALDHETLILKNGTCIPISRKYREETRKEFFEQFS